MKKLSRDQIKEKEAHAEEIRDKKEALDEAIVAYNKAMEEPKAAVEKALEELNEAIREANEWRTNTASDMQSYMDERSDKWHEGEAGSQYSGWKDKFEEEMEAIGLELPEELEEVECEYEQEMNDLPNSPGEM